MIENCVESVKVQVNEQSRFFFYKDIGFDSTNIC